MAEKIKTPAATSQPDKNEDLAQIRQGIETMKSVLHTLGSRSSDPETRNRVTKAFSATGRSGNNGDPYITVEDNHDPKGGFHSVDHFFKDVARAGYVNNPVVTKTLSEWHTKSFEYMKKASSGMNELVGSEGGFMVPPEFANDIFSRAYDNPILERCKKYSCSGNEMNFPYVDETSRVDGERFGGVLMYWDAEASQFTATKPRIGRMKMSLQKLIGICYATEELIQDSGNPLQQWIMDKFASEVAFQVGAAIIRGSGSGKPQGVLNLASLVTVSKETGQAASTIIFENIVKMYQRMYAPSRANAVWLINQDTEQQLAQLSLPIGIAGAAAYLPARGLADSPYSTLMGRPVVPVEFCSTLGTVGDILLVDLSQYYVLRKGETQTESSIHLRFDYAETAFRTIVRLDGKSIWASALQPYKGSNTLSPFVALQTRS